MITKKYLIILLAFLLPLISVAAGDNDTTRAINAALANIKRKGDNVMPMMVPTLDHLIKNHKIDLNIEKQKKNMITNAEGNDRVFLRFFDDKLKAPESQVKLMTGIDRITAASLYCDCYELPQGYFTDVNDMGYSEGYGLTHAVLALTIIENRKCKYDTVAYKAAITNLVPRLVKLIENKKANTDMGIEAVVMLYISGNAALVKNEWVEEIIKAQQPDGSWYGSDHTTVLALWALLEAQKSAAVKP